MRLDKLMYEYIFKGYSIFSSDPYTYQVLSESDKIFIFTNDTSLNSDSIFKLEETELFNFQIVGTNVFNYLTGENDSLDHIDILYTCKREKDVKNRFYKYILLTNEKTDN